MMCKTDTTVQQAMAGDAAALELLWRANRDWIAIVVLSHAPRDTEIEDVMQDIAVAVIKDIHKLREPAAVRGWLRGVAINTCTSAGRQSNRKRKALNGLIARFPRSRGDDARPGADELQTLRTLITSLPEMYSEPLLLSAWRGMTHVQIAELLSIPAATVETRIRRARQQIRDMATPKLAKQLAPPTVMS